MLRKLLVALLVTLVSLGAAATTVSAQELPPDPSCTILSIDGQTVTLEIADMRPNSGGEINFFNGSYYYDDAGNLIPNPFGAYELENGVHTFTLIPGDWTVDFAEWTRDDEGNPGFIIGWGCDQTEFAIADLDPASELRSYLTELRDSGELNAWQYNRLVFRLNRAERAIDRGNNRAAAAQLRVLARQADLWWFGLDADQVGQIDSLVDDIISGLD